jgi:hypothetical protein
MHARDLMELAAIVSAHGPVLVDAQSLSERQIEQYWTASKCRLDRWGRSLKQFVQAPPAAGTRERYARWQSIAGVCEEVLTGEVLTRVWTAVLCIYDRRRGQAELEPVARSVLIGHLEARHRVLTLMVRGPGVDAEEAVKLNHLRRRCERWGDMLVGYLSPLHDIGEFAFEAARARDFADDLHYQARLRGGRHAWPLLLASLRGAFRRSLSQESPNADLNAQIGGAVLACFQPELFDSTGLLRSLWLHRLQAATDDAQVMIDDLLGGGAGESKRAVARGRRFG